MDAWGREGERCREVRGGGKGEREGLRTMRGEVVMVVGEMGVREECLKGEIRGILA